MTIQEESLKLHYKLKGKLGTAFKVNVKNKHDLALAYTPGVAEPCLEIQRDVAKSYELTSKGNMVAVITDGTAVLGLGDIGPEASMPVMEGKCILFKSFAGIDAVPILIDSKDVDEIVRTVQLISKTYGGINLEDISAPRCFEIERRLKEVCDIPVFHDDQHGTAIVAGAGMINAAKVVGKQLEDMTVVVNGAGSAGIAIAKFLLSLQVKDVILCDKQGILYEEAEGLNSEQQKMAQVTNQSGKKGTLQDAMKGADAFIGVSAPGIVSKEMVASMAKDPIVFAMANPDPEIMPDAAKEAGAKVVGTGRSDFANQINNVLAFPGVFKGALKVRAKDITDQMILAAAHAIADLMEPEELQQGKVIPQPFDPRVVSAVSKAVAQAAKEQGVARI